MKLLTKIKEYIKFKKIEKEYLMLEELKDELEDRIGQLTFDVNLLNTMTFGGYEGENDIYLEDSFYETKSIKKIVKGNYNYILAPKGCGKSSLFKAYEERFISDESVRESEKTIIVSVNDTFAYEKIVENNEYMNKNIEKKWAMIWGIFILKKIFKVISSEPYQFMFQDFIYESAKYDEIKNEFEVFDLWDYIKRVNIGIKFNIKGQEITASPSIKRNRIKRNISLNDFYNDLQKYLVEKDLKIYVLIDRVDDFVVGEDREQKKKFIQGLYYCVEEICNERNIIPLFFLRTDLFYNLDMETGSDKIQIRTIELKWEKDELINFIFKRLVENNKEFAEKYQELWQYYILTSSSEHAQLSLVMEPNKLVNCEIGLVADVFRKFIVTFMPIEIEHVNNVGDIENMEFFQWIYSHFEDYTGYINLRYLITFFNVLFDTQYEQYERNAKGRSVLEIVESGEERAFPIFSTICIQKAYHEVQIIAIHNIRSLLENENQKNCFVHIHQVAMNNKASFNYGAIRFGEYDLTKEQYDKLLDILSVLGFLKQSGKRYTLPILYNYKIW